jgi:hypothetical protein
MLQLHVVAGKQQTKFRSKECAQVKRIQSRGKEARKQLAVQLFRFLNDVQRFNEFHL